MKYFLTMISLFFTSVVVHGQANDYNSLARKADSLFKIGDYEKSAEIFSEAFRSNNWRGRIDHRYIAGAAWARAGQADSALFQLEKIVNSGNTVDYDNLLVDSSFISLHPEKRWREILSRLKHIDELKNKDLDKHLATQLEKVYNEDQKYRSSIDSLIKKEGLQSAKVQTVLKMMHATDSTNLIVVSEILDKHGWLGPNKIGERGSTALFLVIQHSDLRTQLKYIPMLRNAVTTKNANPIDLAYLEDRVLVGQNKPQIYGTQIGINQSTGKRYVLPLADPLNVDKRRIGIGLGPLSEYLLQWGIKWQPIMK